jgi:hypothetical protein
MPRAAWRRGSCVANGASWIPSALQEYIAKPCVIAALPGRKCITAVLVGPQMGTKENRHKYEAVLQGVATLCSERPKESKTKDLGEQPAEAQPQEPKTTRIRYSGAARRRHRKQLQREAGERAVQAGNQQTNAAAVPLGTGEQGPSRAVKRSRLDSSIPSPSGVQQTKKT